MRHEPQHRDERDRIAEADHRARGDGHGQRFGECQRQLACRHHRGAGKDQRLGTEAVEQQARGHLGARIHDDLQDDERRQQAGARGEAVARLEAGDAKRGAVEDGDDVRQESGGPHDPGTHAGILVDDVDDFVLMTDRFMVP